MIAMHTVDAFTGELFKGNPAGVCTTFQDVSPSPNLDKFFQQIATEMNLSETAFITKANQSSTTASNTRYFLQWFTPTNEVDLCGHATLATAHILFEQFLRDSAAEEIVFETKKAGELKVRKCEDRGRLQMDFPMGDPQPLEKIDEETLHEIKRKLNITQEILDVQLCKRTKKLLIQLSSLDDTIKPQQSLAEIQFDPSIHSAIRGIILTSKATSSEHDFLSRYFAPWNGILEDPVTGSAHTVLAVYWSRIFKRTILYGYQKSARGGDVECELDEQNQRVLLRGRAVTVLKGELQIQRDDLLGKHV